MTRLERQAVFRQKFNSYRTGFCIFFISYLVSFIAGAILFGKGYFTTLTPIFSKILSCYNQGFLPSFRVLILTLVPPFLIFAAGVTVYSPLVSLVSVMTNGAASGMFSAFFIREGRVALGLFEVIFSSVLGYILVIYATLCTLTAIRIFTDVKTDGTSEIFTGTLFCATGFRRIFNLRYAMSYIAFYIILSLLCVLITLVRALAVSLL